MIARAALVWAGKEEGGWGYMCVVVAREEEVERRRSDEVKGEGLVDFIGF